MHLFSLNYAYIDSTIGLVKFGDRYIALYTVVLAVLSLHYSNDHCRGRLESIIASYYLHTPDLRTHFSVHIILYYCCGV